MQSYLVFFKKKKEFNCWNEPISIYLEWLLWQLIGSISENFLVTRRAGILMLNCWSEIKGFYNYASSDQTSKILHESVMMGFFYIRLMSYLSYLIFSYLKIWVFCVFEFVVLKYNSTNHLQSYSCVGNYL